MFDNANTLTHNLRNHIRELRHASAREEQRQFVIEGVRACTEIANGSAIPDFVVVRSDAKPDTLQMTQEFVERGSVVLQCSVKDMERMSQTKQPQDILCVMPFLVERELGDRVLVLESVTDPGNVGTIIRSAAWFGLTDVVLGEECADLYNPKTMRSAAGSMFAMNILRKVDVVNVLSTLASHVKIGTVPRGGIRASQVEKNTSFAMVIGSEANGLSAASLKLCDMLVTIPGGIGTESLNAAIAASILCYEVTSS